MKNIQTINATKARNNFFNLLQKSFLEKQSFLVKKGNIPMVYLVPVSIVGNQKISRQSLLAEINKLRESMGNTSDSVSLLGQMRQNG